MRTIIFSDTHLTNHFDQNTYNFLYKLISSADKIIINGDFWDGEAVKFEQFIHSKWKKLFPLLLKKNTVYVYGNHDRKHRADNGVNLFSVEQTFECRLRVGKKDLVIEHGDRILPFETEEQALSGHRPWWFYITAPLYPFFEHLLTHLFGQNFFKIYRIFNSKMKAYTATHLKSHEILVTGHTHCAEFNLKEKYINNGLIRHGIAQYMLVENEKIKLVSTHY